MKYLLCGPVSGIVDFNEPAFSEAAHYLRAQLGMYVMNPLELTLDRSLPWGHYMAISTQAILFGDVDGIILLPGWRDSVGCQIEHDIASRMGLPIADYLEVRKNAGD